MVPSVVSEDVAEEEREMNRVEREMSASRAIDADCDCCWRKEDAVIRTV